MKQRLKSFHKTNKIKWDKNQFDPHSQNVELCAKMPNGWCEQWMFIIKKKRWYCIITMMIKYSNT